MSTMQGKRRRKGTENELSPEVLDRLAGLLPEGALDAAVRGLTPDELSGPGGLLSQLAGRVVEAALEAELTEHIGHPPGGVPNGANVRNGSTAKTVQADLGPVAIRTPRDREGSFEPKLVAKRQTRLAGLDDKILGLYAGGMTVRDISTHLSELYATEIGRDTISRITDAVLEDVGAWRTRPLDTVYPIVYFDAMFVKVREGGHWIAGERMRDGAADAREALSRQGRYQTVRENLKVKEVRVGEGDAAKRFIVCHNPAEAERDKTTRQDTITRLQAELDRIAAARAKAKTETGWVSRTP